LYRPAKVPGNSFTGVPELWITISGSEGYSHQIKAFLSGGLRAGLHNGCSIGRTIARDAIVPLQEYG
jgi:hypothetical protein